MADNDQSNPSDIQKHLQGIMYPIDKQGLVAHVKQQGAPEDVLSTLESLPEQQYEKLADVTKAVGDVKR